MDMDKTELEQRQKEIDDEYSKYGLTDEIIDKQIELNKLRHEHDLNLDSELNEEGYVQ